MIRRHLLYRRLLIVLIVGAAILVVLADLFAGEGFYPSETLYSTLEAAGASAAILAAFLLFKTHTYERDERMYFLGMGFLVMGIMQFAHAAAVVGHGMVLLLSFSNLAGATWFALLWLPHRARKTISGWGWVIWLVTISSIIFCLLVIFQRTLFPAAVVGREFTLFVAAMSFLASFLFLAAAGKLFYYHAKSDNLEWFLFAGASALLGLACANIYFSHLWDFNWWEMVVLRLVAVIFVVEFLSRKYSITFSRLVKEIEKRTQVEAKLERTLRSTKRMFHGTIRALSLTLERRDPYTAGHQKRVSDIASAVAGELGLGSAVIEELRVAGMLHDIGKVSVPAEILAKPGKISEAEFSLIKEHAAVGYKILRQSSLPKCIGDAALQHHERMDGSGYPHGIKDDKIGRYAKIIAVADVVEAMSSHRPYRAALGIDAALDEIEKNKGKLYDPAVVDVCVKLFREKGFEF